MLEIQELETAFFTRQGVAKAACGVNYSVGKGEILGVVGESGSGKSVTAMSILRLVPHPGRIIKGRVLLSGDNLLEYSKAQMKQVRGGRIAMIFQEPMISLNPAYTIGNQLIEALTTHHKISRAEARNRSIEMLRQVDIPAPEQRIKDYPHQMSGGMRQRVMIAEVMLLRPWVLLADEPTTALDVTVQAQVLDVMYRLTQEAETAVVLITHNLGLVAELANRVVVMYAGRVVEQGPAREIFEQTSHPYTRGLLKSIPVYGSSRRGKLQALYEMPGIMPSLYHLPTGCAFHPRCQHKMDICTQQQPPWTEVSPGHQSLCWLAAQERGGLQ